MEGIIEQQQKDLLQQKEKYIEKQHQNDLNMLDDVADMTIPKTINTYENTEDNRAQQVISPDGTGTFDGTSTIGSATSEPTTETASRASTSGFQPVRSKKKSSKSRAGDNGSTSGGTKSSRQSSRNNTSNTSSNGYRSAHYGSSRMQQSTVPRPFKRAGPLSYSKTVRLGGTGWTGGREVDDKTRAVLADMNEFDANQAETE
jgi:hypothetical protein